MSDILEIKLDDYTVHPFPSRDSFTNESKKYECLKKWGYENSLSGYVLNPNQFSRTFHEYVELRQLNNGELIIYNRKKGIYQFDTVGILPKLVKRAMNICHDLWNPGDASTALKAIQHDTMTVVNEFNDNDIIVLADGVLNLTDFTLHPHSPEYVSAVQLPFCYNSEQQTPIFNRYLNDISCGDEEIKQLLQEISGNCLSHSTKACKAFWWVGKGANGKSVFASILQNLVGEGNYATTSLSALNGSFGLSSLINVNLNIASENNSASVNPEIFKALVSGDSVEINRKYKDAITMKLHAKHVFLFNTLPDSSNDLSHGFFRRIIIVPFNKNLTEDEIDVDLPDKLKAEMPGIFYWAIEGLKRLIKNQYQFSPCSASSKALEAYKAQLNPAAMFFEDCFTICQGQQTKKSDIYYLYQEYCEKNSYDPLQRQKFWKSLNAYFDDKNYTFRVKKIKGYEYLEGITQK